MADGTIRIDTEIDDSGLAEGLVRLAAMASEAFAGLCDAAGLGLSPLAEQTRLAGEMAVQALDEAIRTGTPAILDSAIALSQETLDALSATLSPEAGDTIGAGFAGGIETGIGNMRGSISGTSAQAAHDAATAAQAALFPGEGHSIGQAFGAGLASGISATGGAVAAAASGIAAGAAAAAKSALGVKSPSRLMAWVGEMFGAGFAQGISGTASEAASAARGVSAAAAMAAAGQAASAGWQAGLPGASGGHAGSAGAAQSAADVHIGEVHIHTEKLDTAQDWEAAGRALSDAFVRRARYKGVLTGGA